MVEVIKISSIKISFKDLLGKIDRAIEERKDIEIPNEFLKKKNNLIILLQWLQKHKIVNINPMIKKEPTKFSIKSRYVKIQIALQLKILGNSIEEIAKKFGVKKVTVEGYLKEISYFNREYAQILKQALEINGLTKDSPLSQFHLFPIRMEVNSIINLKESEINNKWIKLITGKNLGSQELSILLPKN